MYERKDAQRHSSGKHHLTPVRKAIAEETGECAGEAMGKGALCTDGRDVNWCSRCGKRHGGSSKSKDRTAIRSVSSITGYLSKGNKIKLPKRYMQKICITVHSLFTTAETWKQPKCPLTHHKQGVVHTHTRNVTLFSREKEGPPVTRDSTDEP